MPAMNFLLILSVIAVASVIVELGYGENDPPPLDKLVRATEMNEYSIPEVVKDQEIGGGEHGVKGVVVIENIMMSDGIPDCGSHHIPPSATGDVIKTIASAPSIQDGDHDKDINNEQNKKKPHRAGKNRKGGANSGKSGPGKKGRRKRGATAPDLSSDLSADETRNSTGGSKPTEQPGRQTILRIRVAFIALLYLGIAHSLAALALRFIKKRWRSCRRRYTTSTMHFNEESFYPL
ncbi:uncharacterized protein LOC124171577 [Ischnura elegans]|uniref:uncharacterized protein LOC124171577 n=1 Tax=Ischnura elegans TaxID=197161 RepID=UPI001ED87280|nr:uncharacterized protein LOC124171577 [Ischnura elegans]